MPFSLLPKIIANRLTDITPELLYARDIRLLMLDFDNTIVPYTTDVPTQAMEHRARTVVELSMKMQSLGRMAWTAILAICCFSAANRDFFTVCGMLVVLLLHKMAPPKVFLQKPSLLSASRSRRIVSPLTFKSAANTLTETLLS